jgi:hypothetical protein
LVATLGAPSASPECPRCKDPGRIIPGAYYSDPASQVFEALEAAVEASHMTTRQLGQLGAELEEALPSPVEAEVDDAFGRMLAKLGLDPDFKVGIGRRVAMRMVVTIANTRSQPAIRESGVMRLPQTIAGLFDKVPVAPRPADRDAPSRPASQVDESDLKVSTSERGQPH